MKKPIFTLLMLFFVTVMTCAQQLQITDEKFYYEIGGLVYVKPYYIHTKTKETNDRFIKIPKEKLQFRIVSKQIDSKDNSTYYVIQFPFEKINKDSNIGDGEKNNSTNCQNNAEYIKFGNNKYYWLRKDEFDNYVEENDLGVNCIYKSYRQRPFFTYGAKLSLPFKLRTKVNNKNVAMETDITLGGFAGCKCRLSPTMNIYTSVIFSGGLVSIPINSDNVSGIQNVEDGKIFGLYYSLGALVELSGFEFGFFWGFDSASGEIGKYWIYNNMPWFSFSIGYSFFGNTSEK